MQNANRSIGTEKDQFKAEIEALNKSSKELNVALMEVTKELEISKRESNSWMYDFLIKGKGTKSQKIAVKCSKRN